MVKIIDDTQELSNAIETAIKECKDGNAQVYLRAIPQSINEYGKKGLRVQLLYCLSNMQYWKGETAKNTKIILKKWVKILEKME